MKNIKVYIVLDILLSVLLALSQSSPDDSDTVIFLILQKRKLRYRKLG